MTNVMEMKRSNLELPTSGYELDREEMSYVEGEVGFKVSAVAALIDVTFMVIGGVFAVIKIFGKAAEKNG